MKTKISTFRMCVYCFEWVIFYNKKPNHFVSTLGKCKCRLTKVFKSIQRNPKKRLWDFLVKREKENDIHWKMWDLDQLFWLHSLKVQYEVNHFAKNPFDFVELFSFKFLTFVKQSNSIPSFETNVWKIFSYRPQAFRFPEADRQLLPQW